MSSEEKKSAGRGSSQEVHIEMADLKNADPLN
jgi:hypothetical protein